MLWFCIWGLIFCLHLFPARPSRQKLARSLRALSWNNFIKNGRGIFFVAPMSSRGKYRPRITPNDTAALVWMQQLYLMKTTTKTELQLFTLSDPSRSPLNPIVYKCDLWGHVLVLGVSTTLSAKYQRPATCLIAFQNQQEAVQARWKSWSRASMCDSTLQGERYQRTSWAAADAATSCPQHLAPTEWWSEMLRRRHPLTCQR